MDNYLELLEKAKKEYQQYVEIRQLCEFPVYSEDEPVPNAPPNPELPLNTNRIRAD